MLIILVGVVYLLTVFATGFVLGTIRVLLPGPRFSAFAAVACEARS